jgi:hypothetical protein
VDCGLIALIRRMWQSNQTLFDAVYSGEHEGFPLLAKARGEVHSGMLTKTSRRQARTGRNRFGLGDHPQRVTLNPPY